MVGDVQSSRNIVRKLNTALSLLMDAEANLRGAAAEIRDDNGEDITLRDAIGALHLVRIAAINDLIRWESYNSFRKSR